MWPFSRKERKPKIPVVCESVKPSEGAIEMVLSGCANVVVAAQWLNWACEELNMKPKYWVGHPYTIEGFWILYEACKRYKEKTK